MAVTGFFFNAGLIVFLRFTTSHGLIESLTFHSGMGGDIQLLSALTLCPSFCGLHQLPSDAGSAAIFGHLNAGKLQILLTAAKKCVFHGSEAFQLALKERAINHAAGGNRILQALYQKPVFLFSPILSKWILNDDPFAIDLPSALVYLLMTVKIRKKRYIQLLR